GHRQERPAVRGLLSARRVALESGQNRRSGSAVAARRTGSSRRRVGRTGRTPEHAGELGPRHARITGEGTVARRARQPWTPAVSTFAGRGLRGNGVPTGAPGGERHERPGRTGEGGAA